MALWKTVDAGFENSTTDGTGQINAMSITRTVKNGSGVDIGVLKPICNAGWDGTDDCMLIRLPQYANDIIIGVTIDSVNNGCSKVIRYVATGLISGLNSSAWAVNKFLYAKTDGILTDDPTANGVIAQEIGLVLRSHATAGEVYISTMANQVKFLQLQIATLAGTDADVTSGGDGETFTIKGGAGDGVGAGGDVELIPGAGGAGGPDGVAIIPQAGTTKTDAKYLSFGHDGTDGFIGPSTGELKTNNKVINTGTAKLKGSTALLSGLAASQIVETDADKNLITQAKKTAYNADYGTTAGTVCQGNDSRLANIPSNFGNAASTSITSFANVKERTLTINGTTVTILTKD